MALPIISSDSHCSTARSHPDLLETFRQNNPHKRQYTWATGSATINSTFQKVRPRLLHSNKCSPGFTNNDLIIEYNKKRICLYLSHNRNIPRNHLYLYIISSIVHQEFGLSINGIHCMTELSVRTSNISGETGCLKKR